MFAIIETGGKQYKVSEGDIIYVEKLDVEPSSEITLDRVLAVEENGSLKFGKPTVDGATVTASVVKNGKAKKILVFKYKAKKNYRRRKGHRQPYTKLQINKISV